MVKTAASHTGHTTIRVPFMNNLVLNSMVAYGLEGPPGIGKTAAIEALARPKDHPDGWFPVRTLSLSLCGNGEVGGVLWAQEGKDGSVFASRALPDWFVDMQEAGRGIVFFDELTTAMPSVQATALRIINERAIESHKLPQGVIMIAGYNKPEHVSSCIDMSPAMANRLRHVSVKPNASAWVEGVANNWGKPQQYGPTQRQALLAMAAFIQSKPSALFDFPKEEIKRIGPWPSPRSWFNGAMAWGAEIEAGGNDSNGEMALCQLVGADIASEYHRFRKALDLPSPELLLKNPELFTPGNRMDIVYTALGTLVDYVMARADGPDGKEVVAAGMRAIMHKNITFRDLQSMYVVPLLKKTVAQGWQLPKDLGNLSQFLTNVRASGVKKR